MMRTRLSLFVLIALLTANLTGCATANHAAMEAMTETDRDERLRNMPTEVLCSGYNRSYVGARTEAGIRKVLMARGVTQCVAHGKTRELHKPVTGISEPPAMTTDARLPETELQPQTAEAQAATNQSPAQSPSTVSPQLAEQPKDACTGIEPCEEASPAQNRQRLDTCVQVTLAVIKYELEERLTPGMSSTELYYRLPPYGRAEVSLQDFRALTRRDQETTSLDVLALVLIHDSLRKTPPPPVLDKQLTEVFLRNTSASTRRQPAQGLRQMEQICRSRKKE